MATTRMTNQYNFTNLMLFIYFKQFVYKIEHGGNIVTECNMIQIYNKKLR